MTRLVAFIAGSLFEILVIPCFMLFSWSAAIIYSIRTDVEENTRHPLVRIRRAEVLSVTPTAQPEVSPLERLR